MVTGSFRNSRPSVQILLTLFAIVVGFTTFMFLGMIISHLLFGTGLEPVSSDLNPDAFKNIGALKFLQTFFSIGLFVFPAIMVAWFVNGNIWGFLKLNKTPPANGFLLVILLVLFCMPLINFLAMENQNMSFPAWMKDIESSFKKMEANAQKTTEVFLNAKTVGGYLINLFVIALIPAVGEELLFRGVFQRLFHNWTKNIHLAIFISAFIFSALHLQFYGFFPRLVLGALFGYLFFWTQNLWLPIIAHFFNNAMAVTLYFMKSNLAKKAETFGTGTEMIPSVIVSVIVVSILLYLIYKLGQKGNDKTIIQIP